MALYEQLRDALRSDRPAVLATVVSGPNPGAKLLALVDQRTGESTADGSLGDVDLDRVVLRDALGELASGQSGVRHYGLHGEAREDAVAVVIESFAPPPRLLIFGAVDFTAALVRVAKVLGYHITVCDAREVFATRQRFPLADEIVVDWPHRLLEAVGPTLGPADAVCVLTHDHKFDVPAILAALDTSVGYIGAMGSRRTAAERHQLLLEAGADEARLARLMAPIGLDIGSRTPEETAISICAEIITVRTGRQAASLRDTTGPLHPTRARHLGWAVDLGRYPLDDPAAMGPMVDAARAGLARDGVAILEGFLRPAAIEQICEECRRLDAVAHHSVTLGTPYLALPDESFPPDHPRRHEVRSSLAAVAYDLIGPDSLLRALYEWEPLLDAVAAMLDRRPLYRYADPFGALNVAVMGEGDELGWHFDQTDFVVSIALQSARHGGDFESATRIRQPGDERYDAVRAVLEGGRDGVTSVPMRPGTLMVFEGRHSMHRVTPIAGDRRRYVALLAYDTRPDTDSSELLKLVRYGRLP